MAKITTIVFLLLFSLKALSQTNKPIDEIEAQVYLGKYQIEHSNFIASGQVRFENANLYFFTEGIPEVKLLQLPENDKFKADKFEVILQFIRDDFKEVIAAKIFFQGQEFFAKKDR
jgi:hypothetical protein